MSKHTPVTQEGRTELWTKIHDERLHDYGRIALYQDRLFPLGRKRRLRRLGKEVANAARHLTESLEIDQMLEQRSDIAINR